MNELFWICVHAMQWLCTITGVSYEALNIWLFVIIQPALIVMFFVLWMRQKSHTRILHREHFRVK